MINMCETAGELMEMILREQILESKEEIGIE